MPYRWWNASPTYHVSRQINFKMKSGRHCPSPGRGNHDEGTVTDTALTLLTM
jgi:hypothetical protein